MLTGRADLNFTASFRFAIIEVGIFDLIEIAPHFSIESRPDNQQENSLYFDGTKRSRKEVLQEILDDTSIPKDKSIPQVSITKHSFGEFACTLGEKNFIHIEIAFMTESFHQS